MGRHLAQEGGPSYYANAVIKLVKPNRIVIFVAQKQSTYNLAIYSTFERDLAQEGGPGAPGGADHPPLLPQRLMCWHEGEATSTPQLS